MSAFLARLGAAVRARLHENWRELLLRAWSVRFMLLAALCDGLAEACSFFTDAPAAVRPWVAAAALFFTVAAVGARLMPQGNVNGGGA
ncbi:hypothetical protein SAMN02799622_00824 [Methylobacterium sp. UNC378MF]|uniref:DUF7940 domain-containing protein n=1 Tax=Methylobacterium sp. UNC378MF TaxID=1502748 RepID=UPI0008851E75|nr:hypothetical protein [Methylobacterium sp. UNC378MF]SDA12831.1 hypothetical protein SAMN02799622_00824 [Methylobacterium sp. UNC378MF]